MRVVFDTNVVVSAAFFGGQPRAVLDAWADGLLDVAMTPSILEEYFRVCERLRASYPDADFEPLLFRLVAHGTLIPDSSEGDAITADPDDDKFMRCAVESGSTVVSGDHHLHDADGWRGVRVMTPSELLASLRR